MNLLLALPLVLAPTQSSIAATAPSQGPTEARVYDLSDLELKTCDDTIDSSIWPVVTPYSSDEGGELNVNSDEEGPATLLRLLFARELEYEGNDIEYLGEGRFVILAPAALHERIARVLPQLAAALTAHVELEVDRIRVEGGALPESALMPDAQARSLVDAASQQGRLERRRVSIGTSFPSMLTQGSWKDVLFDYDVEVAQHAYAMDPVVVRAQLGTRLALRVAPGRGGVLLALTLRRAEAQGEPRETNLKRSVRVINENEVREEVTQTLLQHLPVLDQGLALNTFLPDGQALVVATSHAATGTSELLVVRRLGGDLTRSVRLGADGDSGAVLLDRGAWDPPSAEGSFEDWSFEGRVAPPDPLSQGEALYTRLVSPCQGYIDLEDLLYNHSEVTGVEPESTEILGNWLALTPSAKSRLPDLEQVLSPFDPDQRVVQVTLTLRAPDSDAPVARVALPLRAGIASMAVLGLEDTYIGDYDVEIAQGSGVEDPVLRSLFQGLMVELTPRFAMDGTLMLGLRGLASAGDGDLRDVDPGRRLGELQTASQRYLMLSDELRLSLQGGRASAQLGDLAGGLALDVEARF